MPEVGTPEPVTVSVPLDTQTRRNLFNLMDMGFNLTSVYPEDWNRGREEFLTHAAPIDVAVTPGDYLVPAIKKSTAFGMISVEYLPLKVAKKFVRIVSGNRLVLERANDYSHTLVPITSLEREAYASYSPNPYLDVYDNGDGVKSVTVYDLQHRLTQYREWRQLHRREYFRTLFGRRSGRLADPANIRSLPTVPRNAQEVPTAQWEKFDQYLKAFQARLTVTENPFDDITILPNKTLSSRYWGIEIEAVDIRGVETPKYWVLHDDGSLRSIERPREGQEHQATCARNLEPFCDCGRASCATNPCDCGFSSSSYEHTETGEWNSPILRSFHSRGLKHLCDQIEFRDTNTSPGIHVHVNAADLTPDQAVQVPLIYTLIEPLIEQEYKRGDTRNYCQSVTAAEMIHRFKKMRRARLEGKKATEVDFGSRYWTVNMAALEKQGTIEFRAMGPRYNYEFLIRWAHFLREIVNLAAAGVTAKDLGKVRNFRDVISVFSKFGKETPTPAWSESGNVKSITLGEENRVNPNVLLDPEIGMGTVFEWYNRREPVLASERHGGDRHLVSIEL